MDTPRDETHAEARGGSSGELPRDALLQRAVGPGAFVLSVVCAVALWSRGAGREDPGPPGRWSSPALPDTAGIEGWVGTMDVPGGDGRPEATLHLRLSPLHADPARQRFDADALRRHLGLGPGEPWRLVLTYRAEAGAPPEPFPDSWDIPLAGWRVFDADGPRLQPIVSAPAALEPGVVADPLRCLLAAPATIALGQGVTVVLWGERPRDEPWLDVPFADRRWSLSARRFDDLSSQPALARLDGRARNQGSGEGGERSDAPR